MVRYERLFEVTMCVCETVATCAVGTLLGLSGVCEGRWLHRNELLYDFREEFDVIGLAACVLCEFLTAQRADLVSTTVLEIANLRFDAVS